MGYLRLCALEMELESDVCLIACTVSSRFRDARQSAVIYGSLKA